jgi:murein DD-endopeptidase MepM/ murein hydrolase activator NlpD
MSRRKWTLLLVADEKETLRKVSLAPRHLRLLAGGAGFFGVALFVVLGFLGIRAHDLHQAAQVQQENALLAAELEAMRQRVSGLQETMASLAERDAEVRAVAGLAPLDADVLQAGVGGPGSLSLDGSPLHEINEARGADLFATSWDLQALERRARLLSESLAEATDSLELRRDILESTPSILPVQGRVTSHFTNARFHPILNRTTAHEGIDISAPTGTPIRASARGRVVAAGRQAGYGLRVEIDHGYGLTTLYAHASRVLVRVGQEVERGDVIAQVGATGTATSPHLHYEVRRNSRPVDPMNYIIVGTAP